MRCYGAEVYKRKEVLITTMVAKNRTNNKKVNESTLFDDERLKPVAMNSELLREDDEPQDEPDRSGENKPETDEAPGAMDEQTLRVECLKIAVKIAKLFDEVQPSDLIEMSDQVFKYVQHQDMTSGEWDSTYGLGDEESNEDETSDEPAAEETPDEDVEDFDVEDLGDLETPEENDEEDKEEEKQDETASEIPDDFFDFEVS